MNFLAEKEKHKGITTNRLTIGRTFLIQKEKNRNEHGKYRPITSLPITYKLHTIGITANQIHSYLKRNGLLSVEHKGCYRNLRGTKDQLLTEK